MEIKELKRLFSIRVAVWYVILVGLTIGGPKKLTVIVRIIKSSVHGLMDFKI